MRISVYIPTKNRRQALEKAVDSVLNQTHQDVEVIVVSDGSTDDTEQYLQQKAAADPRLKYFIKQQSEGAPAARNLAIKSATGHFITGLDDDDSFCLNRLELFIDTWLMLDKAGIKPSFLYAQDYVYRNGKEYTITKKTGQACSVDLLKSNCIGNQIFAPKNTYLESGLFDIEMPAWQDLEFFYRVVCIKGSPVLVDVPTQIIDDTPKNDRISIKAEDRIRNAFNLFRKKHSNLNNRQLQHLYLQLFSNFYGISPNVGDFVWFAKKGFWLSGLIFLFRAKLRSLNILRFKH